MRVSPRSELDAALARLADRKQAWTGTSSAERIALLSACMNALGSLSERWAREGAVQRGVSPVSGEEWFSGPVVTLRHLRLLHQTLRGGVMRAGRLRTNAQTGAIIADGLAVGGAEVWLQPGRPASQNTLREKGPGRVCLVLGGRASGPTDVLSKLFAEDQVVIVKVHPSKEFLTEVLLAAFAPLVEQGFLAVVQGGAEEGGYMAEHALVDTVHVIGSRTTYDALVWGGTDRGQRKNPKPFSAQLGCVTPVLVVPGPWSKQDIEFQARNVAGMVTYDAGFNVSPARVLVVAEDWLQRETFLTAVEGALRACPPRRAEPRALTRFREVLDHYPQADPIGQQADGIAPWTMIRHVAARPGEPALTREAVPSVLAVVSLVTHGPEEFLQRAVAFANDDCWGTLGAAMIAHPSTLETRADSIESAIATLRYGTVAVNVGPGMGHTLVATPWGAFPGHAPEDIQSGAGFVHNAHMFDHPEKAVIRGRFRPLVKPPYFPSHKTLDRLGRALFAHECAPSIAGRVRAAALGALG